MHTLLKRLLATLAWCKGWSCTSDISMQVPAAAPTAAPIAAAVPHQGLVMRCQCHLWCLHPTWVTWQSQVPWCWTGARGHLSKKSSGGLCLQHLSTTPDPTDQQCPPSNLQRSQHTLSGPILKPSIPLLAFIFRRLTWQQSISSWGQLSFWAERFWVSLVSITLWVLLQLVFTKELGVSRAVWHWRTKSTKAGTAQQEAQAWIWHWHQAPEGAVLDHSECAEGTVDWEPLTPSLYGQGPQWQMSPFTTYSLPAPWNPEPGHWCSYWWGPPEAGDPQGLGDFHWGTGTSMEMSEGVWDTYGDRNL